MRGKCFLIDQDPLLGWMLTSTTQGLPFGMLTFARYNTLYAFGRYNTSMEVKKSSGKSLAAQTFPPIYRINTKIAMKFLNHTPGGATETW